MHTPSNLLVGKVHSHEFSTKVFPAGKTPVVASSRTNNPVIFHGVYCIRPTYSPLVKIVLESACIITEGSISPWGHAGDAGHAAFEFCPMYNWDWFLVVSSSNGKVWDI